MRSALSSIIAGESSFGGVTSPGRLLTGVVKGRMPLNRLHRFLFCVGESAAGIMFSRDEWLPYGVLWFVVDDGPSLSRENMLDACMGWLSVRMITSRRLGAGPHGADEGGAVSRISASAFR